jgi:hypothetical protein
MSFGMEKERAGRINRRNQVINTTCSASDGVWKTISARRKK